MSYQALDAEDPQNARQTLRSPPLKADSESDGWISDLDHANEGASGDTYELEKIERISQRSPDSDDDGDDEIRKPRRRRSDGTEQSFVLYTPDEEQAVIKKFDRRLVLFIALLYMLSFLDRSSRENRLLPDEI